MVQDKRILNLKKKMLDYGVKPKDLVDFFDYSWSYVSELLNCKNYASDEQIEKITASLPEIKRSKQERKQLAIA
jgi:hypothetical protein